MDELNKAFQLVEPEGTLIGPDRVHPGDLGCQWIAHSVIKQISSPTSTALVIDVHGDHETRMMGSTAESIQYSDNAELTFLYCPAALPAWINLFHEQNSIHEPTHHDDMIHILGLPEGLYELVVDGCPVSTHSSKQLKRGIQLGMISGSPLQVQAKRVVELTEEFFRLEALIRAIRYTEKHFARARVDYTDNRQANRFVRELLTNTEISAWHREQYETYLFCKPMEQELLRLIHLKTQVMYQNNKPASISVTIRPLSA
ncbi:hypothetical protein [Paenibacillus sp. UNC451MF]|uniref:hypothetical protein n=1 Tax=Paenibacillus sp. UNC451MF TaxID=1449063 RepID=UPI0004918D1D|nr:hypothetical protein [Paenibacillus sp. UNC451MF]